MKYMTFLRTILDLWNKADGLKARAQRLYQCRQSHFHHIDDLTEAGFYDNQLNYTP